MNRVLVDCQRQDERTQLERQILNTLNKETREKSVSKKSSNATSTGQSLVYDSKFSMKIF